MPKVTECGIRGAGRLSRARGLWLFYFYAPVRNADETRNGQFPDRQDRCHRRAGDLLGKAAARLFDDYLRRFNAGAQQLTKLVDFLCANRSKPPAAKAQVARW